MAAFLTRTYSVLQSTLLLAGLLALVLGAPALAFGLWAALVVVLFTEELVIAILTKEA